MKILFTVANANLKGGTEILAFHLLHGLNASGVECRLLSVEPYKGREPLVLSFNDEQYSQWVRLSENPLNKFMGYNRSDAFLRQLICEKAEDIGAEWIINHTYDFCAAIPTDGMFKTAQVFNWSIRGYESSLENIIKRKNIVGQTLSMFGLNAQKSRWHESLPNFTRLVTLTDVAHTEIRDMCPAVRNEQIITIPDPLMQKEDSHVLSSLQNKSLAFVGRLSHEKGVMRLLRIWERIISTLPDYTLNIYGDGYIKAEMDSYITLHNIANVQFMGFCDNLEQIYSRADLLMMTSDSEGFGMVLIEAMYYGVPCISFDCPVSPKDIIADAGVTIPCFDEKAYANEVVQMLQDPERMKVFQRNAVKRASEYYISNVIRKWVLLLE